MQRVRKISGASAADDLGDAWQASLAADDAVGTRTSVAIGRAIVSGSVLRESPADFLADAFDLLGGVLTEGYIASVSETLRPKAPIRMRGTATFRMTVSNKVRRPLKERLKHTPFQNVPFAPRRHPMSAFGGKADITWHSIDREPFAVNSNLWKQNVRQWPSDCQTVVTFTSKSRAN